MTREFDDKEPSFKVVDRRGCTDEGDDKVDVQNAKEMREQEQRVASEKPKAEAPSPRTRPKISFPLFIQSLAHQAMMALGIVPWPDTGLVRTELTMAQETIDILQMLKDKTRGNLAKDEDEFLENLLYQLRIAFVEIAKRPPEDASPIIK